MGTNAKSVLENLKSPLNDRCVCLLRAKSKIKKKSYNLLHSFFVLHSAVLESLLKITFINVYFSVLVEFFKNNLVLHKMKFREIFSGWEKSNNVKMSVSTEYIKCGSTLISIQEVQIKVQWKKFKQ